MKAKDEKMVKTTTMLMKAIQQSGGTVGDNILHMTVAEFIAEVAAPNNIEFRYNQPLVNVAGEVLEITSNNKYSSCEHLFSGCMDVKEKKQVDKLMKEISERIKNGKYSSIVESVSVLKTIPMTECILEKCESIIMITIPFQRKTKK